MEADDVFHNTAIDVLKCSRLFVKTKTKTLFLPSGHLDPWSQGLHLWAAHEWCLLSQCFSLYLVHHTVVKQCSNLLINDRL